LVNKNSVEVDSKKINTEDIYNYIKQKPNRKMLFLFRFHLGVYNYAKLGKRETRFDKWLMNAIGEPPVILDTLLTKKSVKQIKLYMNSKGYFNSIVSKNIIYKKKKANIKYIIHSQNPYKIRNISYSIENEHIKYDVLSDTANSLITRGNNYDVDILQNERDRITTNLKNDGYYYFEKGFITYNIDSALANNQLDINMEIRNPVFKRKDYPDSLIKMDHKRYTINDINIYTDYNSLDLDTAKYKKIIYYAALRKKTAAPVKYNFLYKKDTLHIKPKTITQSIFFKQGDYYQLNDVNQTNNRLTDLKMFKFINIQFSESPKDTSTNQNTLDCKIQLTQTPVQSFSIETEATNSAGNPGVAGDVVYQNKNVFRGAEIFKINVSGAMEIQNISDEKSTETGIQKIFNTVETGVEASLDFPKFFIPIKQERFPKYFRPETTINTGVNYQDRPDYTRYIINVSYGYEWKESQTKKHIIYLPEISSVKIFPTQEFKNTIDSINDPRIRNSYEDHLTMALKYSFIFNNQQTSKKKEFSYFRGNIETSGNILRALNRIFNNYQFADGHYEVFNIPYAEYMRADMDYRHYFVFDKSNTLVLRGLLGAGMAYWNSNVLPFEESFYAGGANSLRGWSIYAVGPGSCNTVNTGFNKTGDIDIEANAEYRFPIYGFLKGAFFIDAGNIWLNKKNPLMPDAEFEFDRFYKEIAIDAGFGARFDFSFFIMRLDAAIPFRDPLQPENERWRFNKISKDRIQFNLGIGYPF